MKQSRSCKHSWWKQTKKITCVKSFQVRCQLPVKQNLLCYNCLEKEIGAQSVDPEFVHASYYMSNVFVKFHCYHILNFPPKINFKFPLPRRQREPPRTATGQNRDCVNQQANITVNSKNYDSVSSYLTENSSGRNSAHISHKKLLMKNHVLVIPIQMRLAIRDKYSLDVAKLFRHSNSLSDRC